MQAVNKLKRTVFATIRVKLYSFIIQLESPYTLRPKILEILYENMTAKSISKKDNESKKMVVIVLWSR